MIGIVYKIFSAELIVSKYKFSLLRQKKCKLLYQQCGNLVFADKNKNIAKGSQALNLYGVL